MSGALTATAGIFAGAPGIIVSSLPNGSQVGSASNIISNDGTYNFAGSTGNWVSPATAAVAAFYQVKTVVTSGSFSVDPSAGSYIDCSSTRTWSKSVAGTVTFTLSFREKATGVVRFTQAGITLTIT